MAAVQVMARSGALGADRIPFWGISIPNEVKLMAKLFKRGDLSEFKKVLKFVVKYLEEGSMDEEDFVSIATNSFPEEAVRVMFAGALTLVRKALRQSSLKTENFKEDLTSLKLPSEAVSDLHKIVYGKRKIVLERSLMSQAPHLPKLSNLRWRVDVTISNTSLNRVLEPFIFVELTLSNGTIKTFELPVPKFHELRYNVASILKEMEDIEKKNILKV